jgi:Predicted membrane protein
MSGSQRRGRFRAVGSINAIAIMGGDEIDLREAEIEGGELTLNLVAVMGGATLYIPDTVELDVGGFSLWAATPRSAPSARHAPARR